MGQPFCMKKTIIPFPQVPQLAKTDIAYANGDPALRPFYTYEPSLEAFESAIKHRAAFKTNRPLLVDVLQKQYATLPDQALVRQNLAALLSDDTYTVTTAHQPCFLLGPLYFIYKALTTINLAEAITQSNRQGKKVVPVFVLGSEDHDLAELNHAGLFGKRLVWEPGLSGPVGSMDAATLQPGLSELKTLLGESEAAQTLFARVEKAYTGAGNFAEATQALLHEFFGEYGLIVLNTNDAALKRTFIPIMKAELLSQPAFQYVQETIAALNTAGFKTQAAPREINLFYMQPGLRERIVRDGDVYRVMNTSLAFSASELLTELENHPENFSPNVVLRPLFQELILPNLAYIGGGGELAYWLERKSQFEHAQIHFPMLVRRHSVLWLDKDAAKKLEKLGFSAADFFGDTESLVKQFIARNAAGEVSLADEIRQLQAMYDTLAAKAAAVDPTLDKAVRAEAVKAVGGLEQWESRLVRAEKQKHEVTLNQLRGLKQKLFPDNGLQERSDNFLPYVLKFGESFIQTLKSELQPFIPGFVVLQPED